MRSDQLEYAAWWAKDHATALSLNSPDHGPRHWRDVARIGIELCHVHGVESQVPFLFAAIHDTQRESELSDPDHGQRAAGLARHMRAVKVIRLGEQEFVSLDYALRLHNDGLAQAPDLDVAICWDADRLTIGRVGITPTPSFFSTSVVLGEFTRWELKADAIRLDGNDLDWSAIAKDYA